MNNSSVYILRCWKDDNLIRLRLENPHTSEVHLFASTKELDRFLSRLFEEKSLAQYQDRKDDSHATS